MRALLLFALVAVAACGQPADEPSLQIGELGYDNELAVIDGPIAMGGVIELAIQEPDPENPGYVRPATIAGYHVEPASSVIVTMNERRNLVVRPTVEAFFAIHVESEAGARGSLTLEARRAVRSEVHLVSANGAWAELPASLRDRTMSVLPDGVLGVDPIFFDQTDRPLRGYDVVDWQSRPAEMVTIEPWTERSNRIEVRSVGEEVDVTLRGVPRLGSAGEGAQVTLELPLSLLAAAPVDADVLAFARGAEAGAEAVALDLADERRGAVTIVAGTARLIELFMVDAGGGVLLNGEPAAATVVGSSSDVSATQFFAPNQILIHGTVAGDATVEIDYFGRTLPLEVHVIDG